MKKKTAKLVKLNKDRQRFTQVVNSYVTEDAKLKVVDYCDKLGITVAQFTRLAIDEKLGREYDEGTITIMR